MATTLNLPTIDKGATFKYTLIWKDAQGAPINLAGYSARMQARTTKSAITYIFSLTSAVNGGIVLTPADGRIDITISAATTTIIQDSAGVYDLELQDSTGVVTRLIEGTVTFSDEVTKT